MALSSGTHLGPYEVVAPIGKGGMGEVYRARDPRLGRDVAIKVLSAQFSHDEERLRRFQQEARAAGALSHPNVLTVFDVGSHEEAPYLVTELLHGESLREHLKGKPLPLAKAVAYAAQIARGLAAAHERGIVHRDLKPENVFVTSDGTLKILDFGIAKLLSNAEPPSVVDDATTIVGETSPGVIMGTVAYMSPEQARGEAVDARSDLFSLGVVLHEMLTGHVPFLRRSPAETLYAIIHEDPPAIAEAPAALATVLRRCLEKSAGNRFHSARDLAFALELTAGSSTPLKVEEEKQRPAGTRRWIGVAAGLALLFLVGLGAWWLGSSRSSAGQEVSSADAIATPLTTDVGYEGEPTFSPDGQTIAYVSDRSGNLDVYLKQVSGGADVNITNNPADDLQPAFSPDGREIAFVSSRSSSSNVCYRSPAAPLMGGDIWVMPTLGGNPRRVAEEGNFPTWSSDGSTILFSSGAWGRQELFTVPSSGGEPAPIPVEFEESDAFSVFLLYPRFSPDMRWIGFEGASDKIYVVPAAGGKARRVAVGRNPAWQPDGSIVFSNAERGKNYSLWRLPFSTVDGSATGPAEPLTFGRGRETQPCVSRDGRFIAFAGQDVSANIEALPFDAETGRATGDPSPITEGNDTNYFFTVSPDGKSVVFESRRGAAFHLWRADRGARPVQLLSSPDYQDRFPRWSPDGSLIAFTRRDVQESEGSGNLMVMATDGGNPRPLLSVRSNFLAWMPDGRGIIYYLPADQQLHVLDIDTRTDRALTDEPNVRAGQTTSPDGNWLVFQSTDNASTDVKARPIGGGPSRFVASSAREEFHPFVSPSGRWLYLQYDHKNLWRVPGPAQDWRSAEPEQVTHFPESNLFLDDPQITSDGKTLLYSRVRVASDLWLLELPRRGE